MDDDKPKRLDDKTMTAMLEGIGQTIAQHLGITDENQDDAPYGYMLMLYPRPSVLKTPAHVHVGGSHHPDELGREMVRVANRLLNELEDAGRVVWEREHDA